MDPVRELLEDLLDAAARHADYGDARYVHALDERIAVRNGELEQLDTFEEAGVGVRVRVGGTWGFAATRGDSRAEVEAALERALAVARAQPPVAGPRLAPEPPARGSHLGSVEEDPFRVPLDDKLAVLGAAEEVLRSQRGVTVARASFLASSTEKLFASTEGALCEQRLTCCGGGISALAVAGGDSQIRSYPASHGGSVAQGGYERFRSLALADNAPLVAEQAVALLHSPPCPAGRTTLILTGEQLGLQVHESVGHAVELDRVLGREASYAGTSFVPADGIGALRVGSASMSVTADATAVGGLGTFRWDDEGVAAQAVPIVREGVLRGFLSSRETAAEIGLDRSGGCMRAEGFARQPLVRMTNVNLEPGEAGSLDDLISATDQGLLIETNRSWSIDNQRLQFQFEGEAAWEIVGGRRGRLLKNPSYAGVTPVFWAGLDAVCSRDDWELVSLLNCGKGEPGQTIGVSHGVAPARFRDVEVGVA